MFGDVRELVLHYFLADDTIEIREVIRANSGRDAAPKFLRRSKVPKVCPRSNWARFCAINRKTITILTVTLEIKFCSCDKTGELELICVDKSLNFSHP